MGQWGHNCWLLAADVVATRCSFIDRVFASPSYAAAKRQS